MLVTLCLGNSVHPGIQQAAKPDEQSLPSASPISGQVTFLYCNDLAKGSEFYGKLLGKSEPGHELGKDLSGYRNTFCRAGGQGSRFASAFPSKPVMLSFLVQNPKQVDEWYARLKALGAEIRRPPDWEQPKNGRRLYGLSSKIPRATFWKSSAGWTEADARIKLLSHPLGEVERVYTLGSLQQRQKEITSWHLY